MKKWNFVLPLILLMLFFSLNYYRNVNNPVVLSVYDKNTSLFAKFLPMFPSEIIENKFTEVISRVENKDGTYGIFIKEIGENQEYKYNQSELFYAASLYKTPIAAAAFKEIQQGNMSLDEEVEILGHEFADGTGSLNQLYPGAKISLGEVIDKLLRESDNTAQNILWRVVPKSQIISAFNLGTIKNYFYVNNTATPAQISNFFENLITSEYLDSNYKALLLNIMSATIFDDRIHQGLSQDVKFSHKIGNWPETSSWHDCGIAQKNDKKIIVCIMSRNTTYEDFISVSKDIGEFVNILF